MPSQPNDPWWKIPMPIVVGVLAVAIPLSVSAMAGIFCCIMVYAGLKVATDNWTAAQTWNEPQPLEDEENGP